jgi:hypothetical protein
MTYSRYTIFTVVSFALALTLCGAVEDPGDPRTKEKNDHKKEKALLEDPGDPRSLAEEEVVEEEEGEEGEEQEEQRDPFEGLSGKCLQCSTLMIREAKEARDKDWGACMETNMHGEHECALAGHRAGLELLQAECAADCKDGEDAGKDGEVNAIEDEVEIDEQQRDELADFLLESGDLEDQEEEADDEDAQEQAEDEGDELDELTENELAELPDMEREHAMYKYQQRREEMVALLEEGQLPEGELAELPEEERQHAMNKYQQKREEMEALLEMPEGGDSRTQEKDEEAHEEQAADEALLEDPGDPRTKEKNEKKGEE